MIRGCTGPSAPTRRRWPARTCASARSRWTFTGIDLSGADLTEATLWDASFAGANLSGADLTRAEVEGADLSTATLKGVRSGSTQGLPILPAGWAVVGGHLVRQGANLTDDLTSLDLTGTSLAGTNLTDADLSGLDLTGFDLTGATLTGADLAGTTLTAARSWVGSGPVASSVYRSPPASWQLRTGFLMGPGADFAGANTAGRNLSGSEPRRRRLHRGERERHEPQRQPRSPSDPPSGTRRALPCPGGSWWLPGGSHR